MTPSEIRQIAVPYQEVTGWKWPNFTPEEIACRGTGLVPDPARCPQFVYAMNRLQALRDIMGIPLICSSGYRTPEYNSSERMKKKGAVANSRHTWAIAFDILLPNANPRVVELKAIDLGFNGIGRYPNPGGVRFIHIDARADFATWGDNWKASPKRFDDTAEHPGGVSVLLSNLREKFRVWLAGTGILAMITQKITDVIGWIMGWIHNPLFQLSVGGGLLMLLLIFLYLRFMNKDVINDEDGANLPTDLEHGEAPPDRVSVGQTVPDDVSRRSGVRVSTSKFGKWRVGRP